MQLPHDAPEAREIGDTILAALQRNPLFMAAALPLKVFPPLFNRYSGGDAFGSHVDNAIRQVPGLAASRPHRSVRHAVLRRSRRLRRRRAGRRGHLRQPSREAAGRATWCCIRRPASITSPPVTARRARLLVLLDPEPGARRRPAHAALRHGHGDPAARPRRSGSSVDRSTHRRLSQPAAAVVRALSSAARSVSRDSVDEASRSVLFWVHLIAGTIAGVVILDHVGHRHAADVPAVGAADRRAIAAFRRGPPRRRPARASMRCWSGCAPRRRMRSRRR